MALSFVIVCLFPPSFRGAGKAKEEKFPLSSLVFALSLVSAFTVHSDGTAVDAAASLSALLLPIWSLLQWKKKKFKTTGHRSRSLCHRIRALKWYRKFWAFFTGQLSIKKKKINKYRYCCFNGGKQVAKLSPLSPHPHLCLYSMRFGKVNSGKGLPPLRTSTACPGSSTQQCLGRRMGQNCDFMTSVF